MTPGPNRVSGEFCYHLRQKDATGTQTLVMLALKAYENCRPTPFMNTDK